MSGHSKWSQIKRQKGAADVKRGQTFTKLGKAITIAVHEGGGGDIASNFKLRLAVEKARAANMPKDNIQRAIDRGLGRGGAEQLDSVVYEAYAPGKVAIVIVATTENKNKTTSEVKNMIEKSGGSFVSPGTVSWMFADSGTIAVPKAGKSFDELFEAAVDSGAEDVEESGEVIEVYTKPHELDAVKRALEGKGLVIEAAELVKKPTTLTEVSDAETAKKVMNLIEKLEEHDDVQKVYANFDIPDNLLG